jgi:ferric enterobactin receptor
MKKKLLSFLLSMLLVPMVWGQSPADIVVKDEYYNNRPLNEVLSDLQSKYKFKVDYEADLLKNYKISYWFQNVKLIDGLRAAIQKTKDLSYYIDETNMVHIVVKGAASLKKESAKQDFDDRYLGNPEKFNFTLSGKVIDKITGESLPFGNVAIRGERIGAQTNVDGYFTLLKVPSDTVALLVSYIGYKNTLIHLSPKKNLKNFIIEIEPDLQQLEEVTVTGEKAEVLKANEGIGVLKITPRNLTKLPNVGERDPFRAFQLMPGVSASNESSSGLYVRGGTPDQTLVLYDGFTVYHVDHLFGFFSAFNYNAIKDMQLYKGGFDAKYGGRISAVAEITGKEGNHRKFSAGADVSMLSTNAFIESPIGKKLTVLVAARRSWKGPLYQKIFNKFTAERQAATAQIGGRGGRGGGINASLLTQTAASYFYDLNAKVTWNPTTKDIITMSLYNGTDNMDNSSSGSQGFGRQQLQTVTVSSNDLSNWGNLGGSLKWSRKWTDKFYSNALVSYSDYYSRRDNTRSISFTDPTGGVRAQSLGSVETNNLSDLSGKVDFEYKITPTNQLEFGTQLTQNTIKYDYIQNDTINVLSRNSQGFIGAVYAQDHIKLLNNKLTFKPGLRATMFGVTQQVYLEPRVSGGYVFNSRLRFKAAVGRYYQFAKQINREDLQQGNRSYWLLANNDGSLPVTKSDHIIVGGSYETPKYLIDVEFYQKNNTGITEYTLRFVPQIRRGLTPQETFFNGSEVVRGVDVLLQKKFGDLNGWIGYTLAEAVRTIDTYSNQPYYSDQDVRHQFKFVLTYRWKKTDLALTQVYATGRPYTAIVGAYNVTLLDGNTRDFTMPSDKNANRFADYHRMDASATYNTKWGSIGVSVFNAYNRQNIWYKRFQVVKDGTESVLQTTNVTYLGITPNLTISWKLK